MVGVTLNAPETCPVDPYFESRVQHIKNLPGSGHNDKLKQFLENDRKILRFYCVWDDRDNMFGELREFVIHYYLVDHNVEVREVHKPNDGRDAFPILLRKQPLPKHLADYLDLPYVENYTWKDFGIGALIFVLGRQFLM